MTNGYNFPVVNMLFTIGGLMVFTIVGLMVFTIGGLMVLSWVITAY